MVKNGTNRKQPKGGPRKKINRRSRADVVLAQGVGKSIPRAFGDSTLPGNCWDAFHPSHASLPRSVGPYTVVRTSAVVTSSDKLLIFGTFQENTDTGGRVWTNTVAIGANDATVDVSAANNAKYYSVPTPDGVSGPFASTTAVPSAISVQVMNPNALQTTAGIVQGAVLPMQFAIGGASRTWNSFANDFVSYFKPRLCSAGKLALRGVQMDSYPLNMSEVSDFKQLDEKVQDQNGTIFTWSGASAGTVGSASMNPVGWAPMGIANPNGVALDYLVCVEWRVRFDIGHPACSTHTHHPVSSDKAWDKQIAKAVNLGHGVMDIVERVANVGAAVMPAIRGAGRALPMIAN